LFCTFPTPTELRVFCFLCEVFLDLPLYLYFVPLKTPPDSFLFLFQNVSSHLCITYTTEMNSPMLCFFFCFYRFIFFLMYCFLFFTQCFLRRAPVVDLLSCPCANHIYNSFVPTFVFVILWYFLSYALIYIGAICLDCCPIPSFFCPHFSRQPV